MSSSFVKPRLKAALNLPPQDWRLSPSVCSSPWEPWGAVFRKREQNSGITVIATINEMSNERQNESASALKRYLLTPNRKVTGKKAITPTRVAANTASVTSAPPVSAAAMGAAPI